MGRKRVVVVDDTPEMAELAAELLGEQGYEVRVFVRAEDAFEHLLDCEELPDVLLLDLMMPEMDGEELLRALAEAGIALPTVVYTAGPSLVRRIQARVQAVVHKTDPDALIRTVDRVASEAYGPPPSGLRATGDAEEEPTPGATRLRRTAGRT